MQLMVATALTVLTERLAIVLLKHAWTQCIQTRILVDTKASSNAASISTYYYHRSPSTRLFRPFLPKLRDRPSSKSPSLSRNTLNTMLIIWAGQRMWYLFHTAAVKNPGPTTTWNANVTSGWSSPFKAQPSSCRPVTQVSVVMREPAMGHQVTSSKLTSPAHAHMFSLLAAQNGTASTHRWPQ